MQPKYQLARRMRRSMTPPEYLLWERLKGRHPDQPIFRRQYALGPYILDFYCIRARLAVEVDGSVHTTDANLIRDAARDDWLAAQGVDVCRLQAGDVFRDADGAADGVILKALEKLRR